MGIFDLIKSAINSITVKDDFCDEIIRSCYHEIKASGNNSWWAIKPNELVTVEKKLMVLPDKQRANFISFATYKVSSYLKGKKSYGSDTPEYWFFSIGNSLNNYLLKTKLVLDDEDIENIVSSFAANKMYDHTEHIIYWPVNLLVNQVEKQVKERNVSDKLKVVLEQLHKYVSKEPPAHMEKDQAKILSKINGILFSATGSDGVKPTFFPGDDEFANYANTEIKALCEADKQGWYKLMLHAQKGSGAKPSKKYLDEAKVLFKEFGADKFKQKINDWILFLAGMKEKTEQHTHEYNNRSYTYTTTEFLNASNIDMIKGLIWNCTHFHDKLTLFNVAKLAERAFRKIPGKGPAASGIGNACLYVLANSKGLDGVGQLSRLRLRIKQSSTQNLIEKYLQEAADAQSVSVYEIEDMAVDDYGLQDGKRAYEFDGYKAILEITAVGKTTVSWFKPDGTPQKSVPAAIKEKYAAKLKKIKETSGQVELTVSAQRDRIDRMLKSNRTLSGTKFNEFYFSHGLMCFLTKQIIWFVEQDGNKQTLFFHNGNWCTKNGQPVTVNLDDGVNVSLWHPVFATVEEIATWREFMMEHKIIQPLKQAFREVYLLTDAEINTRTYSNRMAAHILKQHQFNSLAKTRGWKYSLMGAYDNGIENQVASIDLKEFGLRAEFWINEVNADDAFNETGIWLYIATDQVRFIDIASGGVKELIEVPAVLLSEVMRDVDLFVGVASVGNDPNWRDSGGLPAYRDYWQAYSFGELGEVAKTRKAILENLLPRLKIAKVASIKDKFLVVKGSLRTYKIHLGSTNILMEPNDQYLCIVPERGKHIATENVFLPFEGDTGLSVILSKAMLLAEDTKITDTTITSQINKK
ncbi:MAG: DUF4132 domain-containing protein [Ferruginibacter sp.]